MESLALRGSVVGGLNQRMCSEHHLLDVDTLSHWLLGTGCALLGIGLLGKKL